MEWLKDRNGVHFYGRGIIYSELPKPNTLQPFSLSIPLAIEIWLQPDAEPDSYLNRILSLYGGEKTEDFFVGQWKSYLILHANVVPETKETYREISVKNALPKGQSRFITITSDGKGTCIYVEGRLEKANSDFAFIPKGRKALYQMILGNSPRGKDYWKGYLFGLAIYRRSLTADRVFQHFQHWMNGKTVFLSEQKEQAAFYLFNERVGTRIQDQIGRHDLLLLPRFTAPQKNILMPPWKDFQFSRSYFGDMIINVLGFIPFGFLIFAYLQSRKIASSPYLFMIVIFLGGLLSLTIELIQVHLPSRHSQLIDLLSNTLGTFLGAFIVHFYNSRK